MSLTLPKSGTQQKHDDEMEGQDEESYDYVYPASSDSDKTFVTANAIGPFTAARMPESIGGLISYGLLSGKRQSQEVQTRASDSFGERFRTGPDGS